MGDAVGKLEAIGIVRAEDPATGATLLAAAGLRDALAAADLRHALRGSYPDVGPRSSKCGGNGEGGGGSGPIKWGEAGPAAGVGAKASGAAGDPAYPEVEGLYFSPAASAKQTAALRASARSSSEGAGGQQGTGGAQDGCEAEVVLRGSAQAAIAAHPPVSKAPVPAGWDEPQRSSSVPRCSAAAQQQRATPRSARRRSESWCGAGFDGMKDEPWHSLDAVLFVYITHKSCCRSDICQQTNQAR